jgi:hypothetical protein
LRRGAFPFQRTFGADYEPLGVDVADIDGDGHLDIAVASFGSGP